MARWAWLGLLGACAPAPVATMADRRLPPPTAGPDVRVYGYLAYWNDDLASVPWDELTDIALFAAEVEADGSLSQTSRWGDVEAARALADVYGVSVHLCFTAFDSVRRDAMLSSPSARARLVDELAFQVQARGAHGVNVDIEGIGSEMREEMVALVTELAAAVPEVVVATPAVNWGAWDVAALSQHADLFIMGYDYHWRTSTEAGPVDPLYGGPPWNEWSHAWTLDDYRTDGADLSRVILGLPLYGFRWPTVSDALGASTTGSGDSVTFDEAKDLFATYGRRFEPVSRSPWTWDGSGQIWAPDRPSVVERVEFAAGEPIAGLGFWALHYEGDDPGLWASIRAVTTEGAEAPEEPVVEEPEPSETARPAPGDTDEVPVAEDGAPVADAGLPFFAYTGETVELSGEGSRSNGNGALSFRWRQIDGPRVNLDDDRRVNPRFIVRTPGLHRFELVVRGADGGVSEPAVSVLVVTDPKVGKRYAGCDGAAVGGSWAVALAALFARRRERARRRDAPLRRHP